MIEATKWGAKAILTDRTAEFLQLRAQMEGEFGFPWAARCLADSPPSSADDWLSVSAETTWRFQWTSIWYTSLANYMLASWERYILEKAAGQFHLGTAASAAR